MIATIITVYNPFELLKGREIVTLDQPFTIAEWIRRNGPDPSCLPLLCFYQGKPLLRADWTTAVIQDHDVVIFMTLPQGRSRGGGGGGKNPLHAVLSIAAMVIAAPMGGMMAGSLGITSTIGTALITAGVAIAGTQLVNLLVPPPRPHVPSGGYGSFGASPSPSPTYSLQAQGNQARCDAPIPVIYGRHKVFPDFASLPYGEYKDNHHYLYQLHCIGQGHYEVEHVCLGETPLTSFEEVVYEILPPDTQPTLFDTGAITCPEVTGQELPAPNEATLKKIVGPFIVNPPQMQATAIGIDILLPRGLYYANNSGGLDAKTVAFEVQARPINDKGEPLGPWKTLGRETITGATLTPQRKSYRYPTEAHRYEVQLLRTDNKDTSARAGHEIRWAGLKAYLATKPEFKGVTMVALKMKASDALAQTAVRSLNCIVTRKLRTWSPEGGWSELTPTRSIAWAYADCATSSYGGSLEDARLDLAALYAYDQTWKSRSDNFDGVFDQRMTVWEGLTKIARVGRAVPYLQGGILRILRDEPKSLPVALFGPRSIVKGSLKVHYVMPSSEAATSITVQYFSHQTWKSDEVTVSLDENVSYKAAKVTLFGCTDERQAKREAFYMAASNRYRRRIVTFTSEAEGLIPTYGDLIAITHDLPSWGQGGEIIACEGRRLTTSEPLKWKQGQEHCIALRRKDGGTSGPWRVQKGDEPNTVILLEPLDMIPYIGLKAERTHYAFGAIDAWSVKARVLSIKPRSELMELTAVIDHDAVHRAP